uniref:Putative secreted protein n=1 Tax=Anopheles marajoara TaxID=58244 RepID=A0A2M4CBC6_9DIPT
MSSKFVVQLASGRSIGFTGLHLFSLVLEPSFACSPDVASSFSTVVSLFGEPVVSGTLITCSSSLPPEPSGSVSESSASVDF